MSKRNYVVIKNTNRGLADVVPFPSLPRPHKRSLEERMARLEERMDRAEERLDSINERMVKKSDITRLKVWILGGVLAAFGIAPAVATTVVKAFF